MIEDCEPQPPGDLIGSDVAAEANAIAAALDLAKDHLENGRAADGRGVLTDALRRRTHPKLWYALAEVEIEAGDFEAARLCLGHALDLNPRAAGLWDRLGMLHLKQRRARSAEACFCRAIALAPGNPSYNHNLGLALRADRRDSEAILAFDAALRLAPDRTDSVWEQGESLRRMGQYDRGWPAYHARRHLPNWRQSHLNSNEAAAARQPQQEIGRHVLLLSEQGLGDHIWCLRYLPALLADGRGVRMQCPAPLAQLVRRNWPQVEIVDRTAPVEERWEPVFICDLPAYFHQMRGEPVSGAPYITADPKRPAPLPPGGKLRVGFAWSGNVSWGNNKNRSIRLLPMLRALLVPGVQLFVFQKGPAREALQSVSPALRDQLVDLDDAIDDFEDTAAFLRAMDLLVAVDTSVVHLAGAMGIPCWMLTNHVGHWLWETDPERTAWYDSVRLLRAETWNGWRTVLDKINAGLVHATR